MKTQESAPAKEVRAEDGASILVVGYVMRWLHGYCKRHEDDSCLYIE